MGTLLGGQMKYYQNPISKEVFGYDETNPFQLLLIDQAIKNQWMDITNSYPLSLSQNKIIAKYKYFAQQNIDSIAQSWGYDSLVSAASYANSTNPQFKADAEALIAFRDEIWDKTHTIISGDLPDTIDEFLKKLPTNPNKPKIKE